MSYDPNSSAQRKNSIADWTTATVYSIGDDVEFEGNLYTCTVAHTSSAAFTTDYNAATPTWELVNEAETITKTAAYQMLLEDRVILADGTGGTFAVTLPSAIKALVGLPYNIKKIDSSANAITINTLLAQTIDGLASLTITTQNFNYALISDGTNWRVI